MSRVFSRGFAAVLAIGVLQAVPSSAQDFVCPGGAVVVQGGGSRAHAICEAADLAIVQLASCNLSVPQPITVEITQALPGNCSGLYHCSEDLIQILPLTAFRNYATDNPDSPFSHLNPEVLFDSVLRHELTHAALDGMPCPYATCPATQEFAAYTMQIWFLSRADRAPIDGRIAEMPRQVSREGVNALVLAMSPSVFVENAWAFLSQYGDPCSAMADIARGNLTFDIPLQ